MKNIENNKKKTKESYLIRKNYEQSLSLQTTY